jgi:hypothetical protein
VGLVKFGKLSIANTPSRVEQPGFYLQKIALSRIHHYNVRFPRSAVLCRTEFIPFAREKAQQPNDSAGTKHVTVASPRRQSSPKTPGNRDGARQELRDFLDKARGCHVELILKDISTVRSDRQRLWQWVQLASEVAEEYA